MHRRAAKDDRVRSAPRSADPRAMVNSVVPHVREVLRAAESRDPRDPLLCEAPEAAARAQHRARRGHCHSATTTTVSFTRGTVCGHALAPSRPTTAMTVWQQCAREPVTSRRRRPSGGSASCPRYVQRGAARHDEVTRYPTASVESHPRWACCAQGSHSSMHPAGARLRADASANLVPAPVARRRRFRAATSRRASPPRSAAWCDPARRRPGKLLSASRAALCTGVPVGCCEPQPRRSEVPPSLRVARGAARMPDVAVPPHACRRSRRSSWPRWRDGSRGASARRLATTRCCPRTEPRWAQWRGPRLSSPGVLRPQRTAP